MKAKVKLICFSDGETPLLVAQPLDSQTTDAVEHETDRVCAEKLLIFNTSAQNASMQERLYLCQMPF